MNPVILSVITRLRLQLRRTLSCSRSNRVEIAEIIGDALGAVSIMGLLILLCFIGEILR